MKNDIITFSKPLAFASHHNEPLNERSQVQEDCNQGYSSKRIQNKSCAVEKSFKRKFKQNKSISKKPSESIIKSQYFQKTENQDEDEKQNSGIKNINKMSLSLIQEKTHFSSSLQGEQKQKVFGKIVLKKFINNEKVEIGKAKEAIPIQKSIIIKKMKEKIIKITYQKEQKQKQILDLKAEINEVKEEMRSANFNKCKKKINNLSFDHCFSMICSSSNEGETEKQAKQQFKDEQISNLKLMVSWQNSEIESLRDKALGKKLSNKYRRNN